MRSHQALQQARETLVAARQELIESLGDFMCGEGMPPAAARLDALLQHEDRLEQAEKAYAAAIAALVAELGEPHRQCE
jgi:hypothetical protein